MWTTATIKVILAVKHWFCIVSVRVAKRRLIIALNGDSRNSRKKERKIRTRAEGWRLEIIIKFLNWKHPRIKGRQLDLSICVMWVTSVCTKNQIRNLSLNYSNEISYPTRIYLKSESRIQSTSCGIILIHLHSKINKSNHSTTCLISTVILHNTCLLKRCTRIFLVNLNTLKKQNTNPIEL